MRLSGGTAAATELIGRAAFSIGCWLRRRPICLLWVGFHCGRWARRCRPTGSAVLSMPGPTSHVEFMIEKVACAGQKLRPVGSALSPNGLGFADDDKSDMVSLALMDKVVEVDRVSGRARVQVPHTVALLLASCAAVFLGRKKGSPRPVLCLTK